MSEQDDNQEDGFAEEKLIQAIENQIESENPPAARAVFNKLTLVGYEHALRALPTLPDDE